MGMQHQKKSFLIYISSYRVHLYTHIIFLPLLLELLLQMLLLSLQLLGPLLSLLELRLQSVGLLLLLGVGIRQRADLRAKSTQLLLLLGQRFGLNLGLLRLGGGGLNRAVGGLGELLAERNVASLQDGQVLSQLLQLGGVDALQLRLSLLNSAQLLLEVGVLRLHSPMRRADQPKIKISTKSDVWSLGCILYLLLYQKTPFGHIRNVYAKMSAITTPGTSIEYPAIPPYYPIMLVHVSVAQYEAFRLT